MKKNVLLSKLALGIMLISGVNAFAQTKLSPAAPQQAWRNTIGGGTEKTFAPILSEKSIRYGSKTLELTPDGKIECITPDSGVLFTGGACFFLKIDGASQWGWQKRAFDAKK